MEGRTSQTRQEMLEERTMLNRTYHDAPTTILRADHELTTIFSRLDTTGHPPNIYNLRSVIQFLRLEWSNQKTQTQQTAFKNQVLAIYQQLQERTTAAWTVYTGRLSARALSKDLGYRTDVNHDAQIKAAKEIATDLAVFNVSFRQEVKALGTWSQGLIKEPTESDGDEDPEVEKRLAEVARAAYEESKSKKT